MPNGSVDSNVVENMMERFRSILQSINNPLGLLMNTNDMNIVNAVLDQYVSERV